MPDNRFAQMRVATEAKIQQALLDLLEEKAYDEITVREIAEYAEVGTMTFYRHYTDKSAVLQVIEDQLLDEMQALLEPPTSIEAVERVIRRMLLYVRDNSARFLVASKTPAMSRLVRGLIGRGIIDLSQLYTGNPSEPPEKTRLMQDLVATHLVYAQFNLIRWWGLHDSELSLDEMVALVMQLVVIPTSSFLLSSTPRNET